jgi:hypothetical protein
VLTRNGGGLVDGDDDDQSNPTEIDQGNFLLVFTIIVCIIVIWLVIRPGIYSVSPNEYINSVGMTIVYHSRHPDIPFFSSPYRNCLVYQETFPEQPKELAEYNCLFGANLEGDILSRTLLRLPYNRWIYLASSGRQE